MKNTLLLFASTLVSVVAYAQPIITEQPQDASVCPAECGDFEIAAVGGGLTYQWWTIDGVDTVAISGENGTSLSYCMTDSAGTSFTLICSVSDSNGETVLSSTALLSVDSCLAPVADFTWQWNHLEICFQNLSQHAQTVFWLFGDGATNNENADSVCHTYDTAQIYYVKLIAYNDYGMDELEQVVNLLDAGDHHGKSATTVFPNPASEVVNLYSDAHLKKVRMIDMQGRQLIEIRPFSNRATIDVAHMPSGVYVLLIETDTQTLRQRMVVD